MSGRWIGEVGASRRPDGCRFERSPALGYVEAEVADVPDGSRFEIEVSGRRYPATLLHEPVLDPAGERRGRASVRGTVGRRR